MSRVVALLGGSFNPAHVGHLLAATYVHASFEVDEVWLLPAHRHPFGKPLASFEHRVAMCRLLADEASGWLKVSSVEREVGGEGRTVDTLEHLVRVHPDLSFRWVIGSDILADLPLWKNVERIEELAPLLVVHRAGYPSPRATGPALVEISSTDIRRALAEASGGSEGLIPWRVRAYLKEHRLYG